MKKAKTKKKFLPDNVIELMFGLGASIVIIGALLKITHQDLGPITGDLMLSIGLITEAVIFGISGVQGYFTGDPSVEDKGLQTIEAETQNLQSAVDETVAGLSALNNNLSSAAKATSAFVVPKDISENMSSYNTNLASAASKVKEINSLYDSLSSNLSEINSSTGSMNIPEGLGEELTKMKQTINELNAKYAAMLQGMKS